MSTRNQLSDSKRDTLSEIAGLMIPASSEHNVPGADDPDIFAEILIAANRDAETTSDVLDLYERIDADDSESRALEFRTRHHSAASHVEGLVVQCYYRDERVLKTLGTEARSPFPKGFEVEQGDWSLLDTVRKMAPLYRTW